MTMRCDNCGHMEYDHDLKSGLCVRRWFEEAMTGPSHVSESDCACPGYSTAKQESTGLEDDK